MSREEIFERLKTLVRARAVLRSSGATVGSVHKRTEVDAHIREVEGKLREKLRPSVVENL